MKKIKFYTANKLRKLADKLTGFYPATITTHPEQKEKE
jgi:hypothetical protein